MVRALVLSPSWSMTSGEGPTNARPACSTLRANSAFSDRKPYLSARKPEVPVSEDHRVSNGYWIDAVPGVDHVHSMFKCDPDDVVLCEVRRHGGEAFSDLVRFIGL